MTMMMKTGRQYLQRNHNKTHNRYYNHHRHNFGTITRASTTLLLLTAALKPNANTVCHSFSPAILSTGITSIVTRTGSTTTCSTSSTTTSLKNHQNSNSNTMSTESNTNSNIDHGNNNHDNPLLESWTNQPFNLPPFQQIKPHHFLPAFEIAIKEHLQELDAIANPSNHNNNDNDNDTNTPTFENTIQAFDAAGYTLSKISSVFSNMCSSLNTDELKLVQKDVVPLLSRHSSTTYTFPELFPKIEYLYNHRHDHDYTLEQIRLIERIYLDFIRQGAKFTPEQQTQYSEIKAKLASLQTEFSQNVMKDEEEYELLLAKDDLVDCPTSLIQAAREAAMERNHNDDVYVLTLSRSIVEPFLTFSSRRDLREKIWRDWTKRGELNSNRLNLPLAKEILKLRKQQATMHGYNTFAEYQCFDRMAKNPDNVMELLTNVWERAKVSANKERLVLEDYVKEIGDEHVIGPDGIQPWDWRYYSEKVRKAKYDFDESVLRPYLSLEKVTAAVMGVSNKLFGLRYVKRDDIESYHPDVDTYEVYETKEDGKDDLIALFIHDNFARKFKSSGAWMSEYRGQTKNLPPSVAHDHMEQIPIISNNNNFAKTSGSPTLLSFDDANTLFHEMGHGHHGMLSDATYSRLAGTSVLTDWVELPSQLMEHWLEEREVLQQYARHYETNEPVPDEMLDKLKAAQSFNKGFETIEYTACALLDMLLHQMEDYGDDFDVSKFEEEELAKLKIPKGIIMRHRPAHFQHLFASSHYAAGYYVYLWAEVLDADVFAAFKETGDIFDKETAFKARKYIYSSGNTVAPDELFRLFRGRDPDIKFMLEKKGLSTSTTS